MDKFELAHPQDSSPSQRGNLPPPRNPEQPAFSEPSGGLESAANLDPMRPTIVVRLAVASLVAGILCLMCSFITSTGLVFLLGPPGTGLAIAALVIGRKTTSTATLMAICGLVLSAVTYFLILVQMIIGLLTLGYLIWAFGQE